MYNLSEHEIQTTISEFFALFAVARGIIQHGYQNDEIMEQADACQGSERAAQAGIFPGALL